MNGNHPEEETEEVVLIPFYAYEEVPPRVKTREEKLAENLAELKAFDFPPPEQPENDSSGKMAYIHACRRIDKTGFMKYPVSSIAEDLAALDSETLDLSFAGLGVKGSYALAAALRVNTSVTNLVLVGNYITPAGGSELAKAILEGRSVNVLDLSNNLLGSLDVNSSPGNAIRGGHVINELLSQTSPITSLSLARNGLTDSDINLFSEVLADNVMVTHLDLSYNKIEFMGATELAAVIARNSDIHTINLEWNRIPPAGTALLLSDGFIHNNTIKMFNLSSCGVDDSCAYLLSKIMVENAIEEIVIANNNLTAASADTIAKGVYNSSSLVKLVLDGNPLMDAGCTSLLSAAQKTGEGSSFRYLSMLHCGCSVPTVQAGRKLNSETLTLLISEGLCKVGHNMD